MSIQHRACYPCRKNLSKTLAILIGLGVTAAVIVIVFRLKRTTRYKVFQQWRKQNSQRLRILGEGATTIVTIYQTLGGWEIPCADVALPRHRVLVSLTRARSRT